MLNQQPYIWYQFADETNSLATQRYHVQRGTAPTAAQQAATQLRGLLLAFSGCTALTQSYVLPAVEIGTANPLAGILAQRHAVFVFATATAGQYAIIAIPGVRDDMLTTSGPGAGVLLDVSNIVVAGFVFELTSGAWCNKFGHVLTELITAYLQVRDAVFVPDWLQ